MLGTRVLGLFAMLLSALACDTHHLIDPLSPATNLAKFGAVSHTGPADGATLDELVAQVTTRSADSPAEVTFSASGGTLVAATGTGSTLTLGATSGGGATLQLRAPNAVGLVFVRASVGDVTLQDTVLFVRALPNRVDVEPNVFTVQVTPSATVTISAYLRRDIGVVTPGTPVAFSISAPGGADAGVLGAPSPSDSQGVATVKYSPGVTSYRGPVTINATVAVDGVNQSVGGGTTIQLLP